MGASNCSAAVGIAFALVKEFEGFSASPYLCPAGVPTIGYGATTYEGGTRVAMTDRPVSEGKAQELAKITLTQCAISALKASPSLAAAPNKLGAISDFIYNLGGSRYKSSTLRRRIDDGDLDGAADELTRWVRGGGRVLPGLVRRRAAERALFLSEG